MSDIDADEVVVRLRRMFDGRRITAFESQVALIEQPPTDSGFARYAPGDITITIRLSDRSSQADGKVWCTHDDYIEVEAGVRYRRCRYCAAWNSCVDGDPPPLPAHVVAVGWAGAAS